MRIGSVLTHAGEALFEGFLIALLVVGLMVGTTFAAKGGGTGTSGGGKGGHNTASGGGTIAWVMVTDNNGNGTPNWGDTITFKFQQTATTEPHVDLQCKQGGAVVYGATTGFYPGYPWPWTQNMTLASQAWSGGSASCVARLQAYDGSSVITLATQSFTAGA
jgi:hypothetical protein